ncbi:restriction endonuclease [Saccharothrix sp. BKS2]|uniref:restriction endonuclease n=1 Tax=Saccharothrix sp. BKS2 TaxID=3064400 RepID=UPI0039EB4ECD
MSGFLVTGVDRSAAPDWGRMRVTPEVPVLDLGEWSDPVRAPRWEDYAPAPPRGPFRLPGSRTRYENKLAGAKIRFDQDVERSRAAELARQRRVVELRALHAAEEEGLRRGATRHNDQVERFRRGVGDRQKEHVERYLSKVLAGVPLPKGFPRGYEVTYNPRSEQAVVRCELPPRDVVPTTASYRYLPTKDETREIPRKAKEVAERYRGVVSQVALLCLRDLFNADPALHSIGFNGHVHAINPATGEQEYPCILSLEVLREDFPPDGNLRRVDPAACVRGLKAIVSNHPYELEPIQPIIDFDLTKYKFVDGLDAVSTLDTRPDLMDMSPTNFEHLVRQVFEAQGAEGWTTEQSKDDGVDAVIVRRDPLVGGLSIVQAKRYSKVVGVSHIRELAGAMEEKKAGRGVLVTTSWFASGCEQKAREHGRIELIDGPRLVYLIKEHLGKDVLIGIPNRPRSSNGR